MALTQEIQRQCMEQDQPVANQLSRLHPVDAAS
jgi:hypothetical protein